MLKNAFDGIATESALRRIANLLTFARDSQDRIRIVVDSGTINNSVVYNRGSTTSMASDASTLPYSANSWNAMDGREPVKQQYRLNTIQVRNNRWTF